MLRESKGNMYDWITHTWNPIKGKCPHDCSYCYMKRFGEQKPLRLDEKELRTDLGSGNFIFVGSSTDMVADEIPMEWIDRVVHMCHSDNNFLFQTKNPSRFHEVNADFPHSTSFCTTIETNRLYPEVMRNCPTPQDRAYWLGGLVGPNYVTIEPIMDFDLVPMIELIKQCEPIQVNIGADSGNNHLPEPSREKLLELIEELGKFTTIARKSNLGRILCS